MAENHPKILVSATLDILQLKKFDDCKSIYSVNPLYLLINHTNGSKKKNENKYLIFDSTDENKELLKNAMMFGAE